MELYKNIKPNGGSPPNKIDINAFSEKEQADKIWQILEKIQEESPCLFKIKNTLMYWNKKRLIPLTIGGPGKLSMVVLVAQHVHFIKILANGENRYVKTPRSLIEFMLVTMPDWIPEIRSIIEIPSFTSSGQLILAKGYNPETGIFKKNDSPTINMGGNVEEAIKYLLEEVLGDFPFSDDTSKAYALGALIMMFARPMISGPTPLHVVSAPTPGTGKTLLTEVIAAIVGGTSKHFNYSSNDSENRKQITSILKDNVSVILIDNVKRKVDSAALDRAITSTRLSDRILRSSQQVDLINKSLWLLTSNNCELSEDTVRRTIEIRLDAKLKIPGKGRMFRHPNILKWVADHREEIRGKILTLIQYWIDQGGPVAVIPYLGSFEDWSEVIGSILASAGVNGFLEPPEQENISLDDEAAGYFIKWWSILEEEKRFTSGELIKLMPPDVKEMLGIRSSNPLSKYLRNHRDKVIVDYFLKAEWNSKKNQYCFYIQRIENPHVQVASKASLRFRFSSGVSRSDGGVEIPSDN
jgi:ATPase family associated with various cellular activities (AAA)